jgi:hypothetical protein
MSQPYSVKWGDTLTKIAHAHGFASWKEIYYHDDNWRFRQQRPNPDKIYVGDILMIPDRSPAPGIPPAPPLPEVPIPPAEESEPEGVQFLVRGLLNDYEKQDNQESYEDQDFFEIINLTNYRAAVFNLVGYGLPNYRVLLRKPSVRVTASSMFFTKMPRTVTAFAGRVFWMTQRLPEMTAVQISGSTLQMYLPGEVVFTPVHHHQVLRTGLSAVGVEGQFIVAEQPRDVTEGDLYYPPLRSQGASPLSVT